MVALASAALGVAAREMAARETLVTALAAVGEEVRIPQEVGRCRALAQVVKLLAALSAALSAALAALVAVPSRACQVAADLPQCPWPIDMLRGKRLPSFLPRLSPPPILHKAATPAAAPLTAAPRAQPASRHLCTNPTTKVAQGPMQMPMPMPMPRLVSPTRPLSSRARPWLQTGQMIQMGSGDPWKGRLYECHPRCRRLPHLHRLAP